MIHIPVSSVISNGMTLTREGCTYKNTLRCICAASITYLTISDNMKAKYCDTENHDSCPLFLSKLMRGS